MARTSQERKRQPVTAAAGVLDRAAAIAARVPARGKAPARPRRTAPQAVSGNGRDTLDSGTAGVVDPPIVGSAETAVAPPASDAAAIAEPSVEKVAHSDLGEREGLAPPASDEAAIATPLAELAQPDLGQAEPAAPHPLHGYIDEANWTGIKGWVWDPQRPTERIGLELVEGETRLATALASENRPGLILSGIGDGRHGFTIALPEGVLAAGRHVLRLRSADTGAEVPGSPIVLEPSAKPAGQPAAAPVLQLASPAGDEVGGTGFAEAVQPWAAGLSPGEATLWPDAALASIAEAAVPATLRRPRLAVTVVEPTPEEPAEPLGSLVEGTIRAHLDYADWTGIRGWIWDPEAPGKRIPVEVLDGDNRLAMVLASEYRADLVEAGIGDGRHGFTVPLSETLLPFARHILHLRPVGSTYELPSFPLVLTREQVGFDTSVMRFLLGNVMAETARAQQPDDLAPMITNLVEVLDQALSHFYDLTADKAALSTVDVLDPADFSPQVQILIDSIQRNYPPIIVDPDPNPVVSIVIPVFNKFDLTYACVRSIEEHGARIPYEIIIVDDCSRDETVLASLAFFGNVRLVRNSANSGFVLSCNRGFEAARGEYVVFLKYTVAA